MTQYEFVNVWPQNLTSMRVAYGDSNVLRCNIQFAYDRFFTSFTKKGNYKFAVLPQPEGPNDSPTIREMETRIKSGIFENSAIPGDRDYRGNQFQGVTNGMLVPNIKN